MIYPNNGQLLKKLITLRWSAFLIFLSTQPYKQKQLICILNLPKANLYSQPIYLTMIDLFPTLNIRYPIHSAIACPDSRNSFIWGHFRPLFAYS